MSLIAILDMTTISYFMHGSIPDNSARNRRKAKWHGDRLCKISTYQSPMLELRPRLITRYLHTLVQHATVLRSVHLFQKQCTHTVLGFVVLVRRFTICNLDEASLAVEPVITVIPSEVERSPL
jgi:hypothetical protein